MKSVEISGVAKVEACTRDTYANVKINGVYIENLIAEQLLKDVRADVAGLGESSICKVTITIEPYAHMLSVNGVEMELEL